MGEMSNSPQLWEELGDNFDRERAWLKMSAFNF